MADRDFSDSIQYSIVKENLEKNDGIIKCEICGKQLHSISECHFDHIVPYAKGGKSVKDNCQILCESCNLSKSDKQLKEFALEEKARAFLRGETIDEIKPTIKPTTVDTPITTDSSKMTKEEFDERVGQFIKRKGDIHKIDFSRAYNNLPSVWYVKEYYGDLNTLKKAFGIVDLSLNWSREKIIEVMRDYAEKHGDVFQRDLKKHNGLPSSSCILKYFPEYKSFSEFKKEALGLKTIHGAWTKEEVLKAGKAFIKSHGRITQKDLRAENGLPTNSVILAFFGSMNEFQRQIGAPLSVHHEFVTKEKVREALEEYFGDNERVIESRSVFFEKFRYKEGVICKRYGSFDKFCEEEDIKLLYYKIRAYSKKDIDDIIHNWIFSGHSIPLVKELTKNGLPSANAIMKYYENWKEPFEIYYTLYQKVKK